MAQYADRARYIPFRCREVVEMLINDGRLVTPDDRGDFRKFCEILSSVFHFRFHKKLEALKDAYFIVNPDMATHRIPTPDELHQANQGVLTTLQEVLNDANYEELKTDDLKMAYESHAVLRVKIVVDPDDFETVRVFRRGSHKETSTHKTWLGISEHVLEEEILERVVLVARFKSGDYFSAAGRKNLPFEPGSTIIKLFKDIPKKDLEMLFPNSRVTMTLKDKLYVIIPAVLFGLPLLTTKLLTSVFVLFTLVGAYFGYKGTAQGNELEQAAALLSVLIALGSFVLKQWLSYKNRKFQVQKELSDNLYFRNLVNNAGVFHSLVDSAEEEECKETFLAYYFLLTTRRGLTEVELDDTIEAWFENKHNSKIDFEVADALRKLRGIGLLSSDDKGMLGVPQLGEALRRVDEMWDDFFQFNLQGLKAPSQY